MLLGAAVVLVIIASLGDLARRRRPLAWHAHMPWHGLMFAGMTMTVLMIVHLASLYRA
jgi:hypothetical protein